jgi:hypothetical protein
MTYSKSFSNDQFQRGSILSDGRHGMEERAGRLLFPPDPSLAAKANAAERYAAFKATGGIGSCTSFEFFGTGPTMPTAQEQREIASVAGC